jgi:hypothetical protein
LGYEIPVSHAYSAEVLLRRTIRGHPPQPAGDSAKLAREKTQANLDHGQINERRGGRGRLIGSGTDQAKGKGPSLTAYDALLARRSAALGLAVAVLVFLTMLATDDTSGTHASRLGRLAALTSLAGGAGAFLGAAQARSRGEMRALEATGLTPFRASVGAVMGGAVVGLFGVALALVPGVDLSRLFPRALPAEAMWTRDAAGWLDPVHSVRVTAEGALHWAGTASDGGRLASWPAPVAETVIALAVAAVAFPLWATARERFPRRALVCFAVASAAVFVFHLVAAQRTSAMSLVLPPLFLLVDAIAIHRGDTWS